MCSLKPFRLATPDPQSNLRSLSAAGDPPERLSTVIDFELFRRSWRRGWRVGIGGNAVVQNGQTGQSKIERGVPPRVRTTEVCQSSSAPKEGLSVSGSC